MSDVIEVKKRDETGSLRMHRMRQAGNIPAVIYGGGKDSVSISISTSQVDKMIRAGRHIVELGGDVKEDALIKEVQWDAFGTEVLHLDFARIDASESVEVSVSIELRGVAPGTRNGGIVKHSMHEVTLRCAANRMPESVEVNINELQLEGIVTVADLEIADGIEVLAEDSAVVVTCAAAIAVEETEEDGAEGMSEPEVIGRKADDEGDED